ncbi:MAG: ectonucleotide pyrophosphatase/phosphodiesterase [Spirochaetia bacterium]|jgi:predicted AlkP superfamily pyrophosphatase or phosphodiesterase|nr:ectonucleotide pyrophosphatase/phosphodiesterase [Spirochaetia bacterium]
MSNKVIVISSDAMVGEDLEYMSTLPNYQKYLAGGSTITKVSSIYPSVTFPAHATMMTGMFPDRHGIFSNFQFPSDKEPVPWQCDYRFLNCTDIFRVAKSAGRSTAAVLWPVTAGNPAIDYHIADYWAQNEHETTNEAFVQSGTSPQVLEIIKKHEYLFKGVERCHPQRDEFGIACAADIIREFQPDLLMVHPANIDAVRHAKGVFGSHLKPAIESVDRWLGKICHAAEQAGTFNDTDIFLVSDHGQMDVRRTISLNVLFAEHGFIRLTADGKLADWTAYSVSNGMSAVVFLKDKHDHTLREKVQEFLEQLLEREVYGFSKIFTEETCRKEERYGGDFSFVIETDGYTAFADYLTRPLVREQDNSDYRFGRATHGYLPQKGPQPILVAKGPDIRTKTTLEGNHIVNEAPTYAKLLGIDLGATDGHPIMEILR